MEDIGSSIMNLVKDAFVQDGILLTLATIIMLLCINQTKH